MTGKTHTLRFWLIVSLLLLFIVIAIGLTANRYYVKYEIEEYAAKFSLLSVLRRNALKNYFDTASSEIYFWSLNSELLESQREIVALWKHYQANTGDSADILRETFITQNPFPPGERRKYQGPENTKGQYMEFHKRFHPFASHFVSKRGYYDMFMISPQGNIFYSVEKEDDFATNLVNGPYKDTALASAFKQAMARAADKHFVAFSDISSYPPSNMEPAMFMAKALIDDKGELLGVLALQLPTDRLEKIMHFHAGMGDTGETYLVGEDHLMRSASRFSERSTILKTTVKTPTVDKALSGKEGVEFVHDYRNVEVLSAYTTLDIHDRRWAVIAEIDKQEVMEQLASRRPGIITFASFLYALAMWSLWFISPGDWSNRGSIAGLGSGGDFGDTGQV